MAQQVKVPVAKAEDLSSSPGTHTAEGENQPLQIVPRPLLLHCGMSVLPQKHAQINLNTIHFRKKGRKEKQDSHPVTCPRPKGEDDGHQSTNPPSSLINTGCRVMWWMLTVRL